MNVIRFMFTSRGRLIRPHSSVIIIFSYIVRDFNHFSLENAVFEIKRKLYLEMRRTDTPNWPDLVEQIILNFNSRKHQSLGGLRPIDIASKEKAVIVDEYTKKKEETFSEKQKYKTLPTNIKKGDYVFLSIPKDFQRGFELQVRIYIYYINILLCIH